MPRCPMSPRATVCRLVGRWPGSRLCLLPWYARRRKASRLRLAGSTACGRRTRRGAGACSRSSSTANGGWRRCCWRSWPAAADRAAAGRRANGAARCLLVGRRPRARAVRRRRASASDCAAGRWTGSTALFGELDGAAVRHGRRRRRSSLIALPVAVLHRRSPLRGAVRRRRLRRRRDRLRSSASIAAVHLHADPAHPAAAPSRTTTAPSRRRCFCERLSSDKIWSLRCLAGGGRCGVAWNTLFLALCCRRRHDGAGPRLRADRHAHRLSRFKQHAARADGAADHHAALRHRARAHPAVRPLRPGQPVPATGRSASSRRAGSTASRACLLAQLLRLHADRLPGADRRRRRRQPDRWRRPRRRCAPTAGRPSAPCPCR